MATLLQKILYSKWMLAMLVMLVTHYFTLAYFISPRNSNTASPVEKVKESQEWSTEHFHLPENEDYARKAKPNPTEEKSGNPVPLEQETSKKVEPISPGKSKIAPPEEEKEDLAGSKVVQEPKTPSKPEDNGKQKKAEVETKNSKGSALEKNLPASVLEPGAVVQEPKVPSKPEMKDNDEQSVLEKKVEAEAIDNDRSVPEKSLLANKTKLGAVAGINVADNIATIKPEKSERLILAWTKLHAKKPLWNIEPYTFKKCKFSNCVITANRSQLDDADLLLFRIRELKKDLSKEPFRDYVQALDFSDMPPYHKTNQIWVDINQESPVHTHADEEVAPLNDKFNRTINYLKDADLSMSYIPGLSKRDKPISSLDYSKGKTKMALWFVSHCNAASGRDQYVAELQKYNITVDIMGKCTGKSDGCAPGNQTCYLEVRKQYKFYLALENSICKEYITEKFWNTLQSDSYNIPIALGASLKDYHQFAPVNSYLHVRNFTSPKHLAEFMHKLDNDDQAFNSYHKWRETQLFTPSGKENLHCYLCRAANEKTDGNLTYKKLSEYWSRKKNCELIPEPIK